MGIDRTYRVFISSTFKDLEDARKAAISGVSFCRHVPVALDTFGPENEADRQVIKRETERCHIYILILGYRYGQIPIGENRSYTEIEYQHAADANKPVLVFALPWHEVVKCRKEIDDHAELAHFEQLRAFYQRVTDGRHFFKPWHWGDVGIIEKHVIQRLSAIPSELSPPKGLVEEVGSPEDQITAGAVRNVFLKPIVRSIMGFETLYGRTERNIDAKAKAAKFFVESYQPYLEAKEIRGIFFESGSTPAFLAREFPDSFWKKVEFGNNGEPNRLISTNNVLVYLHLWLERHVPCGHFPWGEPEGTYGATYGPIANLVNTTASFHGSPLDRWAREAIEQLLRSPRGLTKENTSLIVMAASGLQLGTAHHITANQEYQLPEEDTIAIHNCFGPHVGSYKNMVFKRYLIETRIPTVLMVDSSKIDCPIDVGRCHFVMGRDLTWSGICERQPLAILVGCKSLEMKDLIDRVKNALPNFSITPSVTTDKNSAFIARNSLFDREFPERADAIDTELFNVS
jgi:hypothetical protein